MVASGDRTAGRIEPHLVLQGDHSPQGVVRVPLLGEGQAVLQPLVLGLQGTRYLAGLCVGRASTVELLQGGWGSRECVGRTCRHVKHHHHTCEQMLFVQEKNVYL